MFRVWSTICAYSEALVLWALSKVMFMRNCSRDSYLTFFGPRVF